MEAEAVMESRPQVVGVPSVKYVNMPIIVDIQESDETLSMGGLSPKSKCSDLPISHHLHLKIPDHR